ncbi:PAS domain S-box protein [Desulfovibrio sp. JC022]|uniref:PAS domain S-box protein n=1 Tax=Desulfovibrio sp. JC022 TaxID=2593642 RepID=UPI0013CFC325|nr:PAS domain S-box protein [Desulfovibrio sp. JC022]NDV23239.1 PAS domain S-box protein [Desulfovibrio sp. JC022]
MNAKKMPKDANRYRLIFDFSPLAMIHFDKTGTILDCNQKFIELMGADKEKLIGFNTVRQSNPKMSAALKKAIQGEKSEYEDIYTSVTGNKTTYIRAVFNPVNKGTNPTEVIATLEDITDRKKVEQKLAESERRHRLVFDHSPLGLVRCDTKGRVIDCNQKFIDQMGSTREKLIGFNVVQNSPRKVSEKLRMAINGEATEYEDYYTSVTGGKTTFIRGMFNPIAPDNPPTEVIGVAEDISERKKVEEKLAKAEARFKIMAENTKDLIYRFSVPNRVFKYVSPACLEMTGYPPGTFYDNSQFFFDMVHPDSQEFMHQQWYDMASGKMAPLVEYRIIDRYGKVKWLQQSNVPFYDEQGNPAMVEGIVRDVTELKDALERVEQEKARAEAASRTKSEFLANMSHEIRTPLNGIMGMLQLMDTDTPAAKQEEYTNAAMQASKRLNNVLSDILDLARVEAGKLTLYNNEFKPIDEMKHVFELFEVTSRHSGVKLELKIPRKFPEIVSGDPARLQQILTNIVGNALKFTHEGHVSIGAQMLPHSTPGHCHLLFIIEDTGVGIADDKMNLLFQSFTQASEGYTRQYQGAGLGLSICKRLAELMGGTIAVDSAAGEGTTFYISLPFAIPDCKTLYHEQPATEPKTTTSFDNYRILIAEDEKVNRLYTKQFLEQLGFTVETVTDGQQVLDKLFYEDFNLVLMDVQMPVMNGIEATQAIRRGEAGAHNKRIPIIAITAYAMQGDRNRFIEEGMNDYIAKPVVKEELHKTIMKTLQRG